MNLQNLILATALLLAVLSSRQATADAATPAERGYRHLLETPYVPADFDQQDFDEAWRVWPEPLRTRASQALPQQRRQMAFARYGLTTRPGDRSGKPLQYVVDAQGQWTINCFACHGGTVAGQILPGLPNSRFALQTLTEDMRAIKLRLKKPLSPMDFGSLLMPLGTTNGTTNAVMFGVILMARRDEQLNLVNNAPPPRLVHHDMDAPPWWHFRKRNRLYIDGFAHKGHRALMQFTLSDENGPDVFRRRESDFQDVYAFLESLRPPKYPFPIDTRRAQSGQRVFQQHCASCHGTYGVNAEYPNKAVAIDEVGTDRVRFDALTEEQRADYARSWFAENQQTITRPIGYVAPPLDGVWASAPYFHNGSVPTLWHVLHPDQRPVVWKRSETQGLDADYDTQRVGLRVQTLDKVPASVTTLAELRRYFNTRSFGKSADGHLFPDELSPIQKQDVLEYLKTL